MTCYVGVDLGTSGCRAVAIEGDGSVRGRASVAFPPAKCDGPRVEQDPQCWWQGILAALEEVLGQIPRDEVAALAVDGTSTTVLLVDDRGRPAGPALMYNDSRARREAARIGKYMSPDSGAHGATGSLAKVLHLQESLPQARHALHQADWVTGRLLDRYGLTDENNALKLGFDPVQRVWPKFPDALGLRVDLLPQVVAPGTVLGSVAGNIANRLGLPSETRVVAGTTDGVAGVLATGARDPGEAVTSLGSTLILKVFSHRPVFAPRFGVYSHRLGERWLAGGASNSGGAVLLAYFSRDELAAMTPRLEPEIPTGLDDYPLSGPGERFPWADPKLEPRLEPRPGDDKVFFQGMLESMARIEHTGYELLARLGAPYPHAIRTVGGGAVNQPWTHMRERFLKVPVTAAEQDWAAYGTALLARDGVALASASKQEGAHTR